MTDFGFGSLVGKYEEYFGRRVTRVLLIIVGLAVAAAGVGAIWQWLISPLLVFFNTPLWGRTLISLVWRGAGIGAGVAVGILLVSAITEWRKTRQTDAILKRAQGLLTETSEMGERHRREIEEAFAEARRELGEGYAEIKGKTADVMDLSVKAARRLTAGDKNMTDQDKAKVEAELRAFEKQLKKFRSQEPKL